MNYVEDDDHQLHFYIKAGDQVHCNCRQEDLFDGG